MQSNWLDATIRMSPEELRTWDWIDALMIPDEDLLTNDEEYDIMLIESEIEEA